MLSSKAEERKGCLFAPQTKPEKMCQNNTLIFLVLENIKAFEAFPINWKPINKNCIEFCLNIAVFNGFNGDCFVLSVVIL